MVDGWQGFRHAIKKWLSEGTKMYLMVKFKMFKDVEYFFFVSILNYINVSTYTVILYFGTKPLLYYSCCLLLDFLV